MNFLLTRLSHRFVVSWLTIMLMAGCATTQKGSQQTPPDNANRSAEGPDINLAQLERPVPNSIQNEIPPYFIQAVEKETRTASGEPGPNYWQQYSEYNINVEVIPAKKKLIATGTITYHNNSPDTLKRLFLEIDQNLHAEGVVRNTPSEVTGGLQIESFAYNGTTLEKIRRRGQPGYFISGTVMVVLPPEPLMPGESVTIQTEWNFEIPQKGASGRMGYSQGNLFFLAYWYPQMRVYDDVIGWFTDPFLGKAEFYHGFADYDVSVTAPAQWLVAATGALKNGQQVLKEPIYNRLVKARSSDEIVQVVGTEDFGNVTTSGENGKVTWEFSADQVSDFAFSLTKESIWDATRTSVGDRDGDGTTDYAYINAFYRESAPLWEKGARYTQHAIHFLSRFTGLPYPWPHMTSVEGGGIIGGGMEFPMMTLTGSYNGRQPENLYSVIAHELAHMWVPMQLANNERWFAWMDEGTTTFNENQAMKDFYPDSPAKPDIETFQSYLRITGTGIEGPIMRRSDHHYNSYAYGIASYAKPASVLATLRGLLGEETFLEAYHTFMDRWQFKHPYPWDLFSTFEDVSGRNLDWFWRSWYFETWILDQAVAQVNETPEGATILIEDQGQIPMPAQVAITLANGNTLSKHIDVEIWLSGATQTTLAIEAESDVTKIVIDPKHKFPDANRANNVWKK